MDTSEVQDRNLDCILEKFQKECDDSLNIYFQSLRLYNEHSDLFSETMRNMMVEYVVMQLFSKWEKFLEEVFIEYMLGGCSLNGDIVNKYVNPIDRDHAYRMIQNVNLYPDWSDIDKVLKNANDFFEACGPFEILKTLKSEITSLKKIRNAIAHSSSRAKGEFEKLVQGKIGYLPDKIIPATFLIDYKVGRRRDSDTYCEHYIRYLKDTAEVLVDYHREEVQ